MGWSDRDMNELQVQTIEKTPAKIVFNFDELSAVLDEQLAKYEGLEFTEKKVKELKETITELNKGKKSLDDYRKATKKELSVSIADFEAKCKNLSNKFDDVIKPLKEQADEFEDKRKDEKREKIQLIVDELIEKEGLNEKFSSQLIIEDSYLNKSTTMKSIREDLETNAHHLGISQDKEDSDKQIIKMTVEIANERYGVELLDSTYIRLLDFKGIEEIKPLILEDAQDEAEKQTVIKEPVPTPVKTKPAPIKKTVTYVEKYEVTGTESQLDALEEYMSSNGITWKVIEE